MLQKHKITLKHDFAEGLIRLIDEYISLHYTEDDDRLVMAGLQEIRQRLYLRMARYQKEYAISLTPVQALSIRIFYTGFINEPTTYMGSKLMLIAQQVAQKFAA